MCVRVTVKKKKEGILSSCVVLFWEIRAFILYVLSLSTSGRNVSLPDGCAPSSRLHGGGSDPKRIRSHRDQRSRHVEELHR